MGINLSVPDQTELKPKILVLGVGGAGGNAVNNMIRSELQGVEFVVANTDAQALKQNLAESRIQLGAELTEGLGAGSKPHIGAEAAEEALEEVKSHLKGVHMCFITAGMGGGTGTGAAPIVAKAAKEEGILTVGVVTKPFQFEGNHRMRIAEAGIEELQRYVDTLIIIPNQNLFRIANEKTTFADAFNLADDVLHSGVRGVTDLMVMPGLINLDFADIRSVMSEMGKAMMGTGEAEGDQRASEATDQALKNPLIDEYSLKGAKGLLINITGGKDLTLFEVDEAVNKVRAEVDSEAELIIGAITDPALEGKMRVSIVATALDNQGPQTKPVVSMVHRIHNGNFGYRDNSEKTLVLNQPTLSATEGATALDINTTIEQNKAVEPQKQTNEPSFENISIENATYLQNMEKIPINEEYLKKEDEIPNFEVDSIELADPQLFSDDEEINTTNHENKDEKESEAFKSRDSEENSEIKEPEMFESTDLEDDLEIPAFLRRQKN